MKLMNWDRVCAALIALTLVACGAGNTDDGSASIIDGSGSPVPDIAVSGPISGFGSVIVEGIHYQTDGAAIYIDGEPASEQDLNLGDFISIQASYDESTDIYTAKVVSAETSVQGVVDAVDIEQGEVEVLGQRVRIEGDTVFDEQFSLRGIGALRVGDGIKVSGASDGAGRIYATRISATQVQQASFAGYVAQLDQTAMTLMLNGVVVDFSGAGFAGYLRAQDWITVVGAFDDSGYRFIATQVRAQPWPFTNNEGDRVRIEGVVEATFAGGFKLQGSQVLYNLSTTIEGGAIKDVEAGVKIALEGTLDADRRIIAKRIRFLVSRFTEFFGPIEQISLGAPNQFNRIDTGTLTVKGKTITVDERTIIGGIGGFEGDRVRLGDVRIGDNVYISALPTNVEGVYLARLLELGWRKDFMEMRDDKPPMSDDFSPDDASPIPIKRVPMF